MARVHKILDIDRTPFLHTHPFWYVSIILKGGYTERVLQKDGSLKTIKHRPGSVIVRSPFTAHRIDAVEPRCTTLFLTWKLAWVGQAWTLLRHHQVQAPEGYRDLPDGMYCDGGSYRKRKAGIWYAKRSSMIEAMYCKTLSIHQNQ